MPTRRAALADAGQLMFPPPAEPVRWGLIVNEVLLNAIASPGRDWWITYAARAEAQGRARILLIGITGALAEYGPWDRDDAEFMQQHMTEQGLHPKALKLRKWITDLPECTGYGKCTRCGRTHTRAISAAARDHDTA